VSSHVATNATAFRITVERHPSNTTTLVGLLIDSVDGYRKPPVRSPNDQ